MKLGMWAGNYHRGFSTLELLIALAVMLTIIASALDANVSAQYWRVSSVTAYEAQVQVNQVVQELQALAAQNFDIVSSTSPVESRVVDGMTDWSCMVGSWCYMTTVEVSAVSTCVKTALIRVVWKIGTRYPTSSITTTVTLIKPSEIIATGGDCVLQIPLGNWSANTLALVTQATHTPQLSQGIDVLADTMYIVASTSPQLRVYDMLPDSNGTLTLLSTSSISENRLNAIDVVRDVATGRRYAYAVQHTNTGQLVVIDVTDDVHPIVVSTKTLSGVGGGSFPQGWRVRVYGNRVYVLTRETAGPELHIFSIINPQSPVELLSGQVNLGRTVNDIAVHEQLIGGVTHRFLFLAASAALKEFAIYDVTNDVPVEVVVVNLPGSEDLMSVALLDNVVYLGRKNTVSGPELIVFDVHKLLGGSTTPLATAEVGSDVMSLRAVGPHLFVGTTKNNAEFQVWQSDYMKWNPMVQNGGRTYAASSLQLAPQGIEVVGDFVYTLSQSGTQNEAIRMLSVP